MSRSLATCLVSAGIVLLGVLLPEGLPRDAALGAGLFALSGAVTNWLAVHMLFERIPGIHGSGVVPARFTEFKAGIRNLILENFFDEANLARLGREASGAIDLASLASEIPVSEMFDPLLERIRSSPAGGLLALVGGREGLERFREPFERALRERVASVLDGPRIREILVRSASRPALRESIEHIVDDRLETLTPRKVKEIVQSMIREHLGWLVVWGGVFGGILGLIVTLGGLL